MTYLWDHFLTLYDVRNALGQNTCDHLTYQGSYVFSI
jgi:hypothetical protein